MDRLFIGVTGRVIIPPTRETFSMTIDARNRCPIGKDYCGRVTWVGFCRKPVCCPRGRLRIALSAGPTLQVSVGELIGTPVYKQDIPIRYFMHSIIHIL